MTPAPRIFISAVTAELKSARELVAKTLLALGYEPDWQDIFETASGTVYDMLSAKIRECQAMVHLVGRRYGAEARQPHPVFGRISYTQFEALYARAQGKNVYYIFCDDWPPGNEAAAEPEELRQLQHAYRERLREESVLRHHARNAVELELLVRRLRSDLLELRRRQRRWAVAAVVVVAGLLVTVGVLVSEQRKQSAALAVIMARLPEAVAHQQANDAVDPDQKRGRSLADLERENDFRAGTLADKLSNYAHGVLAQPEATGLKRAQATYALENYAEAERLAQQSAAVDQRAYETGRSADDALRRRALAGFELAGHAAIQRQDPAGALRHYRAAESLARPAVDPLEAARVGWNVALGLLAQGSYLESERPLRLALPVYQKALGSSSREVLDLRDNLAIVLFFQGKAAEAATEFRAAYDIARQLEGEGGRATLRLREHLAVAWSAGGQYVAAERELREVVARQQALPDPSETDQASTRHNHAVALHALGRYGEALQAIDAAVAARDQRLGPAHADTIGSRHLRAIVLDRLERHPEAEREFLAVLAAKGRISGPNHPETLGCRADFAANLGHQKRYAESEREFAAALAGLREALPAEHPITLAGQQDYADMLQQAGRPAEAERLHLAVHAARSKSLGEAHPDTIASLHAVALDLKLLGRLEEAGARAKVAAELVGRALPADHPDRKRYEELARSMANSAAP
jgi:tetratricopeptide (TPR) repeat protein